MMEQQVVRMAGVDQLAIVAGLRLEPVVCGLDEDVRRVTGGAQHPLNAEDFVADGVAVAEGREHLVDADHARLRPAASYDATAGPVGSCATTASAGGRSWRRRSNQPGSGSAAGGGASLLRRANMSR